LAGDTGNIFPLNCVVMFGFLMIKTLERVSCALIHEPLLSQVVKNKQKEGID
jgi:hypothetical protein